MPVLRVKYGYDGNKITVTATDLHKLKETACRKLNVDGDPSSIQAFDQEGCLIDDDDCLLALAQFSVDNKSEILLITLLPEGTQWTEKSPDVPSPKSPLTPLSSNPGSPSSSRCLTPEVTMDVDENSRYSVSKGKFLSSMPPITSYVKDLKMALKAPQHIRCAKLARARASVRKSLVEKLRKLNLQPGDISTYALKIRDACPDAFVITIKDGKAGDVYSHFLKSIYNCMSYANARDDMGEKGKKRPTRKKRVATLESDDDERADSPEPVPYLCTDNMGCAEGKWEPPMSEDESEEYEGMRKQLQDYDKLPGCDEDQTAKNLFKKCYPLQRHHINGARTIEQWREVYASWPIFRRRPYLVAHCDELLGKNTVRIWSEEMKDLQTLFIFMQNYCEKQQINPSKLSREKDMSECIANCNTAIENLSSKKPYAISTFPLLLGYFKEKSEELFIVIDGSTTDEEILRVAGDITQCPLIVVRGSSIFDGASKVDVVIRGEMKITASDFVDGIFVSFLSYFAFNICYPEAIAKTLEFIQRFFFRINPEKQGRIGPKGKKISVNQLVVRLSNQLTDFEALRSKWSLDNENERNRPLAEHGFELN